MDTGKSAGSTEPPQVDFETVCRQIRAAVEPARAYAVSIHDRSGELVWLTESSMGPDEHEAVRQAFESYAEPESPPVQAFELGDGRSAVLMRVASPARALAGAVMVVVDSRSLGADRRDPRSLMNPRLARELAALGATLGSRYATPAPAPAAAPRRAPGSGAGVDPAAAELERLHVALRRASIALYVQPLVPLAKGSRFRRHEVLLRLRADPARGAPAAMLKSAVEHGFGSMIDRRVLSELIGWLKRNPGAWEDEEARFTVNLTATALHDEHFLKFVELCLAKAGIAAATIGFEIAAADAARNPARFAEVCAALHRLGCPVALDDFGMRTEHQELLRVPGLQALKLTHELIARMRNDKLAQATITAIGQMARVLGMHTVAKRVETPSEREWLTALGIDFLQSNAFAPPRPIDSVAPAPRGGSRPRPA